MMVISKFYYNEKQRSSDMKIIELKSDVQLDNWIPVGLDFNASESRL